MKKNIIVSLTGSLLLLLILSSSQAQESRLNIQVSDQKGNPVSGALVEYLSLSGAAVQTGNDGKATFNVKPEGWIRISWQDFKKIVPAIGSDMLITLDNSDRNVEMGYGKIQSSDRVTSSLDITWSEELSKSSSMEPAESLFGRLTGLTVLQNGGEPWNRTPDMFIRGRGTLNSSSMLVLVDGYERSLASLSVEEIESVSVLKDGAALAMYGQRGANGVLLVSTKRGRQNSFAVDLSFEKGIHVPFRLPEFLDGYHYAQSVNQARILDGTSALYSDRDLTDYQSGEQPFLLPNVDWLGESLKDFGNQTSLSSSFRGGGKAVKYFVTLNYRNERGLFENTTIDERYNSQLKYDRFNFRTNLDIELTSTTQFQIDVAGFINGRKEPGITTSSIFSALYSVPSGVFPVKTNTGNWGGTEYYNNNPVALISSTGLRKPHTRGVMANGRIIQDLGAWVKGLSAEASLAYDNRVGYQETKTRSFKYESVSFTRDPATGDITNTTASVYGTDTDLSASNSFGGQMRLGTLTGKINYETHLSNNDLNASLFYLQDKRVSDGQYNTFLHQNLAAYASWGISNRYFLDGVLSYSGSSILSDGNRFGLFPAISCAWVMSREKFLLGSNLISFLKIRASWGLNGNDIMAANLYDQPFNTGGTFYFTNNNTAASGIQEGPLPTENLTWEKASKFNAGVDAEIRQKVKINIDAFFERRFDILTSASGSVPSLIGVGRPYENSGVVENKGIEASLSWSGCLGDFSYWLDGNFAFARNVIREMNEEKKPYDYLRQTGLPVGQEFGLISTGFFRDQTEIANSPRQLFSEVRPGDVKYKDQNNDQIIDQFDVVPVGFSQAYPEIYYSTAVNLEYKGFGIDALFQGIAHQTTYLNTKSVFWPLRGQNTISSFSENTWTSENASTATLPRLSMLENANNYRKNDIWLKKGDYLKLRHLELFYHFPEKRLNTLKIKSATIYLRGMNLFSIDAVDVLDPEETDATYPTMTSYHLGIQIGF